MSKLYFTRARLKPQNSVAALTPVLFSNNKIEPHAGKALVWSLFADADNRKRDFLWRWDSGSPGKLKGEFLILSSRTPNDAHSLFNLESKEFSPSLSLGDRLAFRLRANAVIRKVTPGKKHSIKHDIVMNALPDNKRLRKDARWQAIVETGTQWIIRQLAAAGAEADSKNVLVDGYEQHKVPTGPRKSIEFSTLDFDGILTVKDPIRLMEVMSCGIGSSKAYGCGLLLIRRA